MSNYTFDSDSLKYLLNKLKEKFALRSEADSKVDRIILQEEVPERFWIKEQLKYGDNDYWIEEKHFNSIDCLKIEISSTIYDKNDFELYNDGNSGELEVGDLTIEIYNDSWGDSSMWSFYIYTDNVSMEGKPIDSTYVIFETQYKPGIEKMLVSNDYTDEYAQLNNKIINDITISNKTDTEYTLTFSSKNGDSSSIRIPYDKYKKSALFVDTSEKFTCLANEENKINYRYLSSLKDGIHTLVVDIVKSTGDSIGHQKLYAYDEIPDYYLYVPDGEDIALRMYFIDSENTMTSITYLEPEVACLVAEYVLNEINDNAYPNCNDGSLTNFIANDMQNDDNTFTRTAFIKNGTPTKIDFRNTVGLTKINKIASTITDMTNAFYNCYNLKGSPVCGPNVTTMYRAYYNCTNLIGSPACGNNVTNMQCTYYRCTNLTGSPVCGDNVTSMCQTYQYCNNLTGPPVCGPNVTNMVYTYNKCTNLGSNGYFYSNKVTNAYSCFGERNTNTRLNLYVPANSTTLTICLKTDSSTSLTGTSITWTDSVATNGYHYNTTQNIYIYPVANVAEAYDRNENKIELISYETTNPDNEQPILAADLAAAFEGEGIITLDTEGIEREISNIDDATYNVSIHKTDKSMDIGAVIFSQDENLTKLHSIGDCIEEMMCISCLNLKGSPICGNNITNMTYAYAGCTNLTGSPVCGSNVTDMAEAYRDCRSLTGSPACGDNVTNMFATYSLCYSLTGSPICGDKVTDMGYAYAGCMSLTGSPVCGPNVIDMYETYNFCTNLTGQPVCGNKVVNMSNAYQYSGVTGQPVCGPNVTNMHSAYYYCTDLTGSPICGPNVTNMYETYYSCTNLSSNGYFYSNKVTNVYSCFGGRNTNKRLNLYVPANSTTLNSCLRNTASTSLTGTSITWTNSVAANGYHYNATRNIYIYPVANVEQAYKDNEN